MSPWDTETRQPWALKSTEHDITFIVWRLIVLPYHLGAVAVGIYLLSFHFKLESSIDLLRFNIWKTLSSGTSSTKIKFLRRVLLSRA